MENIKSIISINPSYLAQLAAAPAPVKFENGGVVVKKKDNSGLFLFSGLIGIIIGFVFYEWYKHQEHKIKKEQKVNRQFFVTNQL